MSPAHTARIIPLQPRREQRGLAQYAWGLPKVLRPGRIRELHCAGLHEQAIALLCGIGLLEVRAALEGRQVLNP